MDRFARGFIGGLTGGIVKIGWGFFAYYILHFTKLQFADWASVLIYGRKAATTAEFVVATIAYLVFVGLLGIVFAYLITAINSRNYLFKGVMYGIFLGLIFYSLPILFKIPQLMRMELNTVISFWVGDIIWGLTLAQTLRWLDQKSGVKSGVR